jgi:hypothetical protein
MLSALLTMCNQTVYVAGRPWFSYGESGDVRPTVQHVYLLTNAPFRVSAGETMYLRDDGSFSFPFVRKNRVIFPTPCARQAMSLLQDTTSYFLRTFKECRRQNFSIKDCSKQLDALKHLLDS